MTNETIPQNHQTPDKRLVDATTLIYNLGISEATLHVLVKKGDILPVKIGGSTRYNLERTLDHFENQASYPNPNQ